MEVRNTLSKQIADNSYLKLDGTNQYTGTVLTIGNGKVNVDYSILFNGESNTGSLIWLEDENKFEFSKDVYINDFLDVKTAINVGRNGEGFVRGEIDLHGTGFPIARYCNVISGNDSGSFSGFTGVNSTNYLTKITPGVMGNGFGHGLVFGAKDNTLSGDDQFIARIYARVDDNNGTLTKRSGRLQFWVGNNGQTRSLDLTADGLGRFESAIQCQGYNAPHEGSGAELRYYSGRASLLGYNRDTPGYLPTEVKGSAFYVNISGDDIISATSSGVGIQLTSSEKLGFWGNSPVVRDSGWSVSNVVSDKTFDASSTTINELANVVGTLIDTLKTYGLLGG